MGTATESLDVRSLLKQGADARSSSVVSYEPYMLEDEDMLNVQLWSFNATKQWCKFDLEPTLYTIRRRLELRQYYDPRWYPDGIPLQFISAHNTKNFEPTDTLLMLLAQCQKEQFVFRSSCPQSNIVPKQCEMGSYHERKARRESPETYAATMCCCLQPRQETPIYWSGKWYKTPADVPDKSPNGH